MGMKPRRKPELKKVPCKQCKGTGSINRHWAAGGGRIGYRSWMEPCPSCRMRVIATIPLEGVERVKFTLAHMKGGPIEEQYRYETEDEIWNENIGRYNWKPVSPNVR